MRVKCHLSVCPITDDRVLEVDGINFQGFTYQQAVECLSKTGEVKNNFDWWLETIDDLFLLVATFFATPNLPTTPLQYPFCFFFIPFLSSTHHDSHLFFALLPFLYFPHFPLLQVVTLVVEREAVHLPRVSLSADTGSISPPTSQLRSNRSSSNSTPPQTVPDRPTDYSFSTYGRKPQLRFWPFESSTHDAYDCCNKKQQHKA